MKRSICILFVAVFLLHFAGCYIYFVVRLMGIHREMKAKLKTLPDHQLQVIEISDNDYKKIDREEDEIEWEDKMFDIAKIKRTPGRYLLYVIEDKAEGDLLAFLAHIRKLSSADQKEIPPEFFHFLSLDYLTTDFQYPEKIFEPTLHSYGYQVTSYSFFSNSRTTSTQV